MTRTERAAARFVREVMPQRISSILRQFRHPEYDRVLAACRLDLRIAAPGQPTPAKRLLAALPAAERDGLTGLVTEVLDVEYDKQVVAERAAFLVGVAVGKALFAIGRKKRGAR